jgi:hypothetical protein
MRTMLRVSIPVEAGNKAILENVIPKLVQQTSELIKPEASYFLGENGKRTCMFFFDMKDASWIPTIAEPWFMGVNAAVEFIPVMNPDELRAGLERTAAKKT